MDETKNTNPSQGFFNEVRIYDDEQPKMQITKDDSDLVFEEVTPEGHTKRVVTMNVKDCGGTPEPYNVKVNNIKVAYSSVVKKLCALPAIGTAKAKLMNLGKGIGLLRTIDTDEKYLDYEAATDAIEKKQKFLHG